MEREVLGITDAAVASYYYESNGNPQDKAQIVVENRGTTALHNLTVEVGSNNNRQTYNISFVPAGETAVVETTVGLPSSLQGLGSEISTKVIVNENLNEIDRNPQDNILNTVILDELTP